MRHLPWKPPSNPLSAAVSHCPDWSVFWLGPRGARPIDVASNAESREFLVTWDPSSTDRIKEDKRKAAKNAEKEETLGGGASAQRGSESARPARSV